MSLGRTSGRLLAVVGLDGFQGMDAIHVGAGGLDPRAERAIQVVLGYQQQHVAAGEGGLGGPVEGDGALAEAGVAVPGR